MIIESLTEIIATLWFISDSSENVRSILCISRRRTFYLKRHLTRSLFLGWEMCTIRSSRDLWRSCQGHYDVTCMAYVRLDFPSSKVKQPDPDPLAAADYSCVYWVDHLRDWDSSKSAKHRDDIQDGGAVDKFLRQKYLYWLEALSLLRSMSEGVLSMDKLEDLLQVSLKSILLSRKRPNITLGKGRGITIDRSSPRCSPIYSILQVGNREHSSPGVYISTRIQSGPQPDERIIQAGGARMDYDQAGYAR